jgi:two-component sensor histidine kinase
MPEFVRAIEGRLKALARAQTLMADDHWAGGDLRSLLRGELAAFLDGAGSGPRVALQGPRIALPARAVQPFSMAIHELATNAIKYGALSMPGGRLAIDWHAESTAGGLLRLRWVETGGPMLSPAPMVQGFGSRVLNGTLRDQLGGKVGMIWAPSGLVCEIAVPLTQDRDIGAVGAGVETPLPGR